MNTLIKKYLRSPWLYLGVMVVLVAISISFLMCVIKLKRTIPSVAANVSGDMGVLAGKAIGSLQGITEGYSSGAEDGKKDGLSAFDMEMMISMIHEEARLEVLVAKAKAVDQMSIGDNKLRALYLIPCTVTFTVDLSESIIEEKDNNIYVYIPKPEPNFALDILKIERRAIYQTKFFDGTTEDGVDAYINTLKKLALETPKAISNYEEINDMAESAALSQVTDLVNSFTINNCKPIVQFKKAGE